MMLVKLYRGLCRRGDDMILMVQVCYNYFRSRTNLHVRVLYWHLFPCKKKKKKTCLFKEGDLLTLFLN